MSAAAAGTAAQAREAAAAAHRSGVRGREVARLMAREVARTVRALFAETSSRHPVAGASLVALGGLGREELAPWSDVDLLLLVPEGAREPAAEFARDLFTPLWDRGFEPGTALRTPEEALEAARDDHTIATSLLDARHLAGDEARTRELLRAFFEGLRGRRLEAFVDAKVAEMERRRERHGDSVYLLEPNIKNGTGGLRDLGSALWIAAARHRRHGLGGVVELGLLPPRDIDQLRDARDTLLRLRCQLHLQAGRRDDRLTYQAQEQAASALGYVDTPEALGVELLMRDYYLAAQLVEHAADAIVDRCTREARAPRGPRRAVPIDSDFELFDGRVTFSPTAQPSSATPLLVRLFAVAEREGAPVYSGARDRVVREVARAAGALATDRAAQREFLEYLESPGADGRALRGLYETGLLGALFPELARLRARAQHDVYHVYTVDTHTVLALEKALKLRAGRLAADEPVFTRLCQDLARPLPLYLGILFHDLGKGLGGDHAARGARLAADYAPRAGLDGKTAADVEFLVREHLKLSHTAFRRDLADPALVQDTAMLAGSRERLDLLYLLTFADISSVGPDTWNDWRAGLLRELYEKCRAVLDAAEGVPRVGLWAPADHSEAARAGERELRRWLLQGAGRPPEARGEAGRAALKPEVERFLAVLPERYLATVAPARARLHFELWRESGGRAVTGRALAGAAAPHPDPGAGELVVVVDDRPGMLALVAGTLAAHSLDILGAELFPLRDGRALDAFVVREPGGLPPSDERVLRTLADLERVVAGETTVEELLARRRGHPALARGPSVPTKIRFDLEAAREATVVDVYTRDRVGLLHDIARALHAAGASIVLARVATEGNRAADGFYIQDFTGRKITDPATLAAIERGLRQALSEPGS